MTTRHITSLVQQSLTNFPAVLLIGARQVGKSTLAQYLVSKGIVDRYITLDDLATLAAVRSDPDGFIQGFTGSVALDEIQRAPDLLIALKKNIDQKRTPGRFLLTGSANIFSYPNVAESLAGRIDVIHLEGLSVGELKNQRKPSHFLQDLFAINDSKDLLAKYEGLLKQIPSINKAELREFVFYGGFPEMALKRDLSFRQRWFAAYQTAYLERDIRDLAKLIDIIPLSKLLRLISLRTANLLNIKNLGADIGIDQRTTARYLQLLEITFQLNQLNPWHTNTRKRLVKTPKIYLNDSGAACYMAAINRPDELEDHPLNGALFETWIWSELRKLLVWDPQIVTSYYRTHQGREVDFVLEKGGQCRSIEIKWASSITRSDFSGLRDMQEAMGEQIMGIIFYTGNDLISFGKNLAAVPLQYLLFNTENSHD